MKGQHDCCALVDRTRDGDPEALAELYSRYAFDVHRIAFRLTQSPEEADDVLQDVFAGLPEALRSYTGRGNFEGWLRKIATRRSLMVLRRRRVRREVNLETAAGRLASERSEPIVDRIELGRALARLPDALRAVFVLHEIEGYSHEEIGEMLGIGRAGSTSKLHRARRVLRERLRSVR